jgi:hypothetical protein
MGLVTAGVAYTTGEITAFMPETGGFVRHASRIVDPALGAATGWNFCPSFHSNPFPRQAQRWTSELTGRRVYHVHFSSR